MVDGFQTGLIRETRYDARWFRGLAYAQRPERVDAANQHATYVLDVGVPLNQGQIGCCVGASLAGAANCLRHDLPVVSMRAIWERAKKSLNFHGNTGVTLEAGCSATMPGVPSAEDFPLREDISNVDLEVPTNLKVFDPMLGHSLILQPILGTVAALSSKHPVVIGTWMETEAFYDGISKGVITKTPPKDNTGPFCHALFTYASTPNFKIVRNSWGAQRTIPNSQLPYEVREIATPYDVVFTNESYEASLFELREITGEAIEPQPIPDPINKWSKQELWQQAINEVWNIWQQFSEQTIGKSRKMYLTGKRDGAGEVWHHLVSKLTDYK